MADARLGNRLRQWRAEQRLTQADLASLAGVSRKTINTVENGVFIPSVLLALTPARSLGTTVETLFYLHPAVCAPREPRLEIEPG